MRRSRRYRDIPIVSVDIETYGTSDQRYGGVPEIAVKRGVMTAEEQRQRAKHGWLNWHMNRGRLPLSATDKEMAQYKRRVSWRRVH